MSQIGHRVISSATERGQCMALHQVMATQPSPPLPHNKEWRRFERKSSIGKVGVEGRLCSFLGPQPHSSSTWVCLCTIYCIFAQGARAPPSRGGKCWWGEEPGSSCDGLNFSTGQWEAACRGCLMWASSCYPHLNRYACWWQGFFLWFGFFSVCFWCGFCCCCFCLFLVLVFLFFPETTVHFCLKKISRAISLSCSSFILALTKPKRQPVKPVSYLGAEVFFPIRKPHCYHDSFGELIICHTWMWDSDSWLSRGSCHLMTPAWGSRGSLPKARLAPDPGWRVGEPIPVQAGTPGSWSTEGFWEDPKPLSHVLLGDKNQFSMCSGVLVWPLFPLCFIGNLVIAHLLFSVYQAHCHSVRVLVAM